MAKRHTAHNMAMPISKPHRYILQAQQDISALDLAVKKLTLTMKEAVEDCYANFTRDCSAENIATLNVNSRKTFDICFGEWLLARKTSYENSTSSFVQIFLNQQQAHISSAQKAYLHSLNNTALLLYKVEETAREHHIVIRLVQPDTRKIFRILYNPILPTLYAGEIVGLRLRTTSEGQSSGYGIYRFHPDIQDHLCTSVEQVCDVLTASGTAKNEEIMREISTLTEEFIFRTWCALTSSLNAKIHNSHEKHHS